MFVYIVELKESSFLVYNYSVGNEPEIDQNAGILIAPKVFLNLIDFNSFFNFHLFINDR